MSATAPVTIPNAKDRILKLYERQFGPWAAGTFGEIADLPDPLPLPSLPWGIALHPPSERTALNDLNGTRRWANAWRSFQVALERVTGRIAAGRVSARNLSLFAFPPTPLPPLLISREGDRNGAWQ